MLLVTTAPNDDPLYKALLPMGDVARMPIPHGDVFWSGPWAGAGVSWCGDRKKTGDLLGCIESGHHIQQVEDALQAGINNIFVVWEQDKALRYHKTTGAVLMRTKSGWVPRKPALNINQVYAYLDELEWYIGVRIITTTSVSDTAKRIHRLYTMSQEPPETHHVLDMVYTPPLREFHMRRPSLVRRWARELDGIGVDLSKQVERRFPRPIDMTLASVQDWMEIPGVGKKKATSLVKDIQGES